jgi:hypothetical protein
MRREEQWIERTRSACCVPPGTPTTKCGSSCSAVCSVPITTVRHTTVRVLWSELAGGLELSLTLVGEFFKARKVEYAYGAVS